MLYEPWIRPELLRRLKMPVLVIAGSDDMIRERHTRRIARSLPNARLRILEGTHFIAAEKPDAFNQCVEAFLEGNSGRRTGAGESASGAARRAGRLEKEKIRRAAVLVPLIQKGGEYHVVFEVRAGSLKTQPGEICFPGGAVERGETPKQAAVRETMEELLINRCQIRVIAPARCAGSAWSDGDFSIFRGATGLPLVIFRGGGRSHLFRSAPLVRGT